MAPSINVRLVVKEKIAKFKQKYAKEDKKDILVNIIWAMLLIPSIYYSIVKNIGLSH